MNKLLRLAVILAICGAISSFLLLYLQSHSTVTAGQARQKVTLKVHYAGGGASTATRSPPLGLDTALATANINAASMRDADFVSGKPSADATDVEHSLRASEALQFPLKDVALDWRDTTTGSSNPHSVVVGKSQALSPPQEQSQKSTAPLGGFPPDEEREDEETEDLDPAPLVLPAPLRFDIPLTGLPRCLQEASRKGVKLLGVYPPLHVPAGTGLAVLVAGQTQQLESFGRNRVTVDVLDEHGTRLGTTRGCMVFKSRDNRGHHEPYNFVRIMCEVGEASDFAKAAGVRLLVRGFNCTVASLPLIFAQYLEQLRAGHGKGREPSALRGVPRGELMSVVTPQFARQKPPRSPGTSAAEKTGTWRNPDQGRVQKWVGAAQSQRSQSGRAPPGWPLQGAPRHSTGVCLGPVRAGDGNPLYFLQWFSYHLDVLKIDHVYLYLTDSMQDKPIHAAVLSHYQRLGRVTLIDWSTIGGTASAMKGWWYNQPAKDVDCLYRFRYESGYLLYFDADEFLYPQGSLYTVPDVVRAWEAHPDYPLHHSQRWRNQWRSSKLAGGGAGSPAPSLLASLGSLAKGESNRLLTQMPYSKMVTLPEAELRSKYIMKPWRVWDTGCHWAVEGHGVARFLDPPLLQHNHYYLLVSQDDHLAQDWVDDGSVVEDVAWIDRYRSDFEAAAQNLAASLLKNYFHSNWLTGTEAHGGLYRFLARFLNSLQL